MSRQPTIFPFFFFNDTATTEIYTLSLHDALPILKFVKTPLISAFGSVHVPFQVPATDRIEDRKSTRLNSSHQIISYAVFCLKKKKSRCMGVYSDLSVVQHDMLRCTSIHALARAIH